MRRRIEVASPIFDMKSSHAIRQQVMVRLQRPGWCADVHPISSWRNMRKESLAFFQKLRKQSVFERVIFTFGDQVKNFWLQDIGSGVDVSTISFAGLRFFHESLNAPIIV